MTGLHSICVVLEGYYNLAEKSPCGLLILPPQTNFVTTPAGDVATYQTMTRCILYYESHALHNVSVGKVLM